MTGLQNALFSLSDDTVYFSHNRISTCVSVEETSPRSSAAVDRAATVLLIRS